MSQSLKLGKFRLQGIHLKKDLTPKSNPKKEESYSSGK
jgi:hypothetical protein